MAFSKEAMTQVMTEKVAPVAEKLGGSRYLQTISQSMMSTLPVLIVGSIATLLKNFPITAAKEAMFAVGLEPVFTAANKLTIGALALYVAFLMGKNLVNNLIPDKDDGTMAGVLSLMAFMLVTPLDALEDETVAIPVTWLGAQGMFSAMIIGLLVGRFYVFVIENHWTIKLPDSVPPMVTNTFNALLPGLIVGVLAMLVKYLFALTPFESMHNCIYTVLQQPFTDIGGSLPAIIIVSVSQQILWFFGIHGTNVILPLVRPLWVAMDAENLAALEAGEALVHIGGMAFFDIVTWGGTALGLVILMLCSKSERYRTLGKIDIVPCIFGITEPVVFGTPLVLNFDLAIPFIFNNTICIIIAYTLMSLGIVSKCAGTQTIFGLPLGFYATVGGSVSIIILQLFLQLVLSPILWYPWFKRLERKELAREAEIEAEKLAAETAETVAGA